MDKNKMLEAFRQHIRNKSTEQLIEDLQEYNIQVVSCDSESLGSVSILDDKESFISYAITPHPMHENNKQIELNTEFFIKTRIEFPMQKIDGGNIKDSEIIKDTDKYNHFPIDWGVVA